MNKIGVHESSVEVASGKCIYTHTHIRRHATFMPATECGGKRLRRMVPERGGAQLLQS